MKHAILGAAFAAALVVPAFAQDYTIMAPANPGGGWDGTARAMQEALGAKLRPVSVSPGLIAYLDAASRARVLAEWKAALEGGE